jgi:ubiquinone biosynthesis protein
MEPELDITAVSRRHVERIFHRRFDPRKVSQELMSGAPELVDLAVDLPQLLAEGAGFVKERLNRPPPSRAPLEGLRSGILAGAFVVGGSIAAVGGGSWFLWGPLFAAGLLLAVFGSS